MELWLALFVIAAIPFIVVVRLGLRSPRVRASKLGQLAVFLLACTVALGVVVILSVRIIQESFKFT